MKGGLYYVVVEGCSIHMEEESLSQKNVEGGGGGGWRKGVCIHMPVCPSF